MKIDQAAYDRMRAWFAHLVPIVFPDMASTEADPVASLDRIAKTSPAQGRRGLAQAIGDIVELTGDWPSDRVALLDAELARLHLPGLTEMRVRCSKALGKILRRGAIGNDDEFHLVQNAIDMSGADIAALRPLIAAYEQRHA